MQAARALHRPAELEVGLLDTEGDHREDGDLAPDELHRVPVVGTDDLRKVEQEKRPRVGPLPYYSEGHLRVVLAADLD